MSTFGAGHPRTMYDGAQRRRRPRDPADHRRVRRSPNCGSRPRGSRCTCARVGGRAGAVDRTRASGRAGGSEPVPADPGADRPRDDHRRRCSAPSTAPRLRASRPFVEVGARGRARHDRLHHRGDEDDELGDRGRRRVRSSRSCAENARARRVRRSRCSGWSRAMKRIKRCSSPTAARSRCGSCAPASELGLETVRRRPPSADRDGLAARRADRAVCIGPGTGRRELPARRPRRAGGARHRVRRDPPRLRLPVGEPEARGRARGARARSSSGPPPEVIALSGRQARGARGGGAQPASRSSPARRSRPDDDARRAADEIGYPVLVKAAGGGGGRGIKLARDGDELDDLARPRAQRGRRGVRRRARCTSSGSSRAPATSRSRSPPTSTARSSTSASATARSSAAIRR